MDKGAKAARLADQIRDYLSGWLRQDFPGRLVSVSDVQLSISGQRATVWLTGFDKAGEAAAEQASRQAAHYQHELHVAMQRRAIPTLRFIVETPSDVLGYQ